MKKEINNSHNYGVDLLRIVSMFMVIILHVLKQGGILSHAQGGSYYAAWLLEAVSMQAVNCFAITSGFVGYSERNIDIFSASKLSKYGLKWIQVAFTGIVCVFIVLSLGFPVTWKEFIKAALPISFHQYWYFSAWTGVFFLAPILNRTIRSLEIRDGLKFFMLFGLLFSVLSTIFEYLSSDPFSLQEGKGFVWLAFLYVVGAYLRKTGITQWDSGRLWKIWIACNSITYLWKIGNEKLLDSLIGFHWGDLLFMTYITPPVFISSICLFALFTRLKIDETGKKLIAFVSPTAFGVYLWNTQPLVFDNLMKNAFSHYAGYGFFMFLLKTISAALLIFMLCFTLEKTRIYLEKSMKVSTITDRVGDRLFAALRVCFSFAEKQIQKTFYQE